MNTYRVYSLLLSDNLDGGYLGLVSADDLEEAIEEAAAVFQIDIQYLRVELDA